MTLPLSPQKIPSRGKEKRAQNPAKKKEEKKKKVWISKVSGTKVPPVAGFWGRVEHLGNRTSRVGATPQGSDWRESFHPAKPTELRCKITLKAHLACVTLLQLAAPILS